MYWSWWSSLHLYSSWPLRRISSGTIDTTELQVRALARDSYKQVTSLQNIMLFYQACFMLQYSNLCVLLETSPMDEECEFVL